MSLGILTSTLQTVKSLKDHDYVQRLHNFTQTLTLESETDYSHLNKRKTRAQLIRLSAAVCGIELCYAAETAFVSPILLKLGVPVAFMTLVWCLSPLLGFFLVPIMGSLSDRCPLSLGRRRPFILLFSVGIILGLVFVPNGEKIGILAGDEGVTESFGVSVNETATFVRKINSTASLVHFQNGSTEIIRSDFSPAWPSTGKLPHKHVVGILITILGVALLDFNCDACQSPCRTYLLDIAVPEEHSRGLTSFTVMAGMGGSVGYLIGGIDWESTSFGAALGGHVSVVFTGVLILFIICVILTVTSFKEVPLCDLGLSKEQLQKNVKKVKKAKYRKFVNESSDEECGPRENGHVKGIPQSYGTLNSTTDCNLQNTINSSDGCDTQEETTLWPKGTNFRLSEFQEQPDGTKKMVENFEKGDFPKELTDVSLKTYLRSIVRMPRSLFVLCLTNLFCWMSLVCYSLYFTDFVGQSVYGGDPRSPVGSREHDLYDAGVRLGSFGMALYSISCALYSMFVEYLVEKFGKYLVALD